MILTTAARVEYPAPWGVLNLMPRRLRRGIWLWNLEYDIMEMGRKKYIANMINIVEGNIADPAKLKKYRINAIVNAARPTLMGSDNGNSVDKAIHDAVNAKLAEKKETFKDKICQELKTPTIENVIRCKRGKAVLTGGYGLCDYVIHVVGAEYDGKSRIGCSSSRVHTLESCYDEIVRLLKEHSDIRNIAIPIISAGEYGFPMETAAQIAIASLGNALIEWKNSDPEMFEMAGIENIYFFIYYSDTQKRDEAFGCVKNILESFQVYFQKEKRVVFQLSTKAHIQYLLEIWKYDKKRGYFAVARCIRLALMLVRFLFIPGMLIKDLVGKKEWEKRRGVVEKLAFFKAVIPLLFIGIWKLTGNAGCVLPFSILIIYNMADTLSYLLTLIVMTDIQRPSANVIRSLIMLFVNYIEVSLDMAFLYIAQYREQITELEAMAFGLLGRLSDKIFISDLSDYLFLYLNTFIRFFFVSLVFGYLANHMRMRRFRS